MTRLVFDVADVAAFASKLSGSICRIRTADNANADSALVKRLRVTLVGVRFPFRVCFMNLSLLYVIRIPVAEKAAAVSCFSPYKTFFDILPRVLHHCNLK